MRGASVIFLYTSCVAASSSTNSSNRAAVFAVKDASALQMHVHVYAGKDAVIGIDDGKWKALSVQFDGGTIAAVDMSHGTPGQLSVQVASDGEVSFFQAAELGGGGLQWPNGHAATVTFEAGTDMSAVRVDFDSINTYVVQFDDPTCELAEDSPCVTLPAIYFGSGMGVTQTAVVAFSGDATSANTYEVYVFAQAAEIRQVSVGFTHQLAESSWFGSTLSPMQVIQGNGAFVCEPQCLNTCQLLALVFASTILSQRVCAGCAVACSCSWPHIGI